MIGIIDYGVGNVLAFANMYKRMNVECKLVRDTADLTAVEKLVLPGVGSFDFAMSRLEDSGLRPSLDELVVESSMPVLGICVGMQMLANRSEEGELLGLGWIDGVVKHFDFPDLRDQVALPHMGWNSPSVSRDNELFDGFGDELWFYFLHSYYFECGDRSQEIARCDYGIEFSCAVNRDNVFGVQFHPEKSHDYGARLLRNFAEV